MKRIFSLLLSFMMVLSLCACGQKETAPTWQEQYDLGIRYLSEGNYEEAIIAFTAAIEIDPKNAGALSGRGQAYVLSGETEENLAAALADFEAALAADETLAEAWLGLADVYIRQGDYDKAMEVLQEALEKTGNDPTVADKLAEMELPPKLQRIAPHCFNQCTSITQITIPDAVKTIGHHAFYKCLDNGDLKVYLGAESEEDILLGGRWLPKHDNKLKSIDAEFGKTRQEADDYNKSIAVNEEVA